MHQPTHFRRVAVLCVFHGQHEWRHWFRQDHTASCALQHLGEPHIKMQEWSCRNCLQCYSVAWWLQHFYYAWLSNTTVTRYHCLISCNNPGRSHEHKSICCQAMMWRMKRYHNRVWTMGLEVGENDKGKTEIELDWYHTQRQKTQERNHGLKKSRADFCKAQWLNVSTTWWTSVDNWHWQQEGLFSEYKGVLLAGNLLPLRTEWLSLKVNMCNSCYIAN